jgi:sugar (pentulose or hexulose) kinase
MHKFVHAKDFIIACLTGKLATDYSNAEAMNLNNLEEYE